MQSKNPVFGRSEAFNAPAAGAAAAGTLAPTPLEEMYRRPSATPAQTQRLTFDDVLMKSAIMFGVLLVAAGISYVATESLPFLPFIGMIGGLGLGLFITFKQSTKPALHLTYAVLEGIFVGGISRYYQDYVDVVGDGTNIVAQAVIGTMAAFTAMLVLYKTGVIKATPKFRKMMLVALLGYLFVALASFVAAILGVGDGFGFYGMGFLGIMLCVAGVALASFSLILDFDFIEQAVRAGAPERTSWLAAFGLMVTLVWLYLELLRLLAILQGRD